MRISTLMLRTITTINKVNKVNKVDKALGRATLSHNLLPIAKRHHKVEVIRIKVMCNPAMVAKHKTKGIRRLPPTIPGGNIGTGRPAQARIIARSQPGMHVARSFRWMVSNSRNRVVNTAFKVIFEAITRHPNVMGCLLSLRSCPTFFLIEEWKWLGTHI